MANNVKFKIEEEITKEDFLRLQKSIKTNVIQTGLDKTLEKSIPELKEQLRFLVNEQIRVYNADTRSYSDTGVIQSAHKTRTTSNTVNGLGQPIINPAKSDQEIIKYVTNGKTDLSKYNAAKDYSTLSESGVVFGQRSKGSEKANRVTLRMDISEGETVQNQYIKAKQFFQEAVFALPDSGGKTKYYSNPGFDITEFVKIKCSTMTGDETSPEPTKGLSPQRRFERATKDKGFAEWTLKQDGVDFIRRNFVDLTIVVNSIKEGDFKKADSLLRMADKNNKMTDVRIKIQELEKVSTASKPEDASTPELSGVFSYINSIKLINNLKIEKKIDDISTAYILTSDYEDFSKDGVDVLTILMQNIRAWVVANEEVWFNKLIKITENVLRDFEIKHDSTHT